MLRDDTMRYLYHTLRFDADERNLENIKPLDTWTVRDKAVLRHARSVIVRSSFASGFTERCLHNNSDKYDLVDGNFSRQSMRRLVHILSNCEEGRIKFLK